MSKLLSRGLIASLALVFVFGFVPVVVFAEEPAVEEVTTISAKDETGNGENLKQRIQELKEQRQENKEKRLETNKLKVCENRKSRITTIIKRSVTRNEKQLQLFSTIAERVKTFYAEKGYSLANYAELVTAVDAAKADTEANLETLKNLEAFDCSSEDPKGDLEAFKLSMKSINQDLKDYRTSVKDLIVGVKSAQSTTAKEKDGAEL